MEILLKMNKLRLQSLLLWLFLFSFAHGERKLNKFKLYNNCSAQGFSNIWERAIPNSSKLIKMAYLSKFVNQSTLNGEHLIKIAKICTFAFTKARNSLVVWCREKPVIWKKQKMVKIYFLKFLVIDLG